MRNRIAILAVFTFLTIGMNGQEIVKLWGNGNPPTSNELATPERSDANWAVDISIPELHIYKPAKQTSDKAVLICPGGGYSGLAMAHEGKDVAEWLNSKGITAVVLKYRMPNKRKDVPLEDAQQAMRYIRDHAVELGVNKNRIGIAGFSAGGHLASTVSTHFDLDGTSTRPDFSILFYPVITMNKATHGGSRTNLLGDNPSSTDIFRFSTEEQVNVNTPPTILLLSGDDTGVSPQNSTSYYDALLKNNIPAAMYIFPVGGHGWGFRKDFRYHDDMTALLETWLDDLSL